MDTKALHLVADLYDVANPSQLDDVDFCAAVIKEAITIAGCTVLNIFSHKFDPQGVTINVTLTESHCTMHTWPEKGYCAIDLYGCGKAVNLKAGIDFLVKQFSPSKHKITKLSRGDWF